jgi:type IV pilus assembly protein PilO
LYEKWIRLARWQKWLIICLMGLGLFGILYYYRVKPLQQELQAKRTQMEQLQLTVSRLKAIERRKNELKQTIEKLKKQIAEIESKLPTGKEEVSQIIKSITDADSGMVITLIKKEPKLSKKYYIAYPYTVRLLGTYPKFIEWCEKLSRANRIINFGNIQVVSTHPTSKLKGIKRAQKLTEKDKYTILVEMKVNAFTLKR